MKEKKSSLGKGLDAIFMENTILDENTSDELEITQIEPNKNQPRKEFDEQALADLSDSISLHGVLQPLLVRPLADGNYQIVAGERRWRASRMAGLTKVPVVIKDLTDTQVLEIALIENLQREDLSPVEEAMAYRSLMENCDMTQEEVSKSVGKSRPYITNSMRLLNLPDDILRMVDKKELTAGHARTLLSIKNEDEIQHAAETTVSKGMSVRELEKFVKFMNESDDVKSSERKKVKNKSLNKNVFFSEVEISLNEHLGRKVKITEDQNGKGGLLQIQFYGQEDLADMARRLGEERG